MPISSRTRLWRRLAQLALSQIAGMAVCGQLAVAQAQDEKAFMAYCSDPPGYAPYVQRCKVPWRKVPAPPGIQPAAPVPLTPPQSEPAAPQPDVRPRIEAVPSQQKSATGADAHPTPTVQSKPAPHPNANSPAIAAAPPLKPAPPPASASDLWGFALAILFFGISVIPLYRARKPSPGQSATDAVVVALRRRAQRKLYAGSVFVFGLILGALVPGGIACFWAGLAAALLAGMFYGQAEIARENFPAQLEYKEAAQTIARVRVAPRFNHSDEFALQLTTTYRGISALKPFLVIATSQMCLIVSPVRYWLMIDGNVSTAETRSMSATLFKYTLTTSSPRRDDFIHGETWIHATKSGDRDYRFKNNWKLYEVMRWGIELRIRDNIIWQLGGLQEPDGQSVLAAFFVMLGTPSRSQYQSHRSKASGGQHSHSSNEGSSQKEERSRRDSGPQAESAKPRAWHEILGVSPNATKAEVTAARNRMVKRYHPDKLSGVDDLGPEFEQLANQKLIEINAAYEAALAAIGEK